MTDLNTEAVGPLGTLLGLLIRKEGSPGQPVDWDAAEALIGHGFPSDYRQFVERLGGGSLEGCLDVRLPLAETDADDGGNRICRIPQEVRADPLTNRWSDPAAAATHRIEDMLIWGESSGADTLCWITTGTDPNKWPVAVYNRGNLAWSVYDCGLTEFILRILQAEFDHCPLSDESLVGMETAR
ncbi:SMI1/KNR4 family protein, partial [Streptomyces xanthophaeus]|uniref:SMI1/KNR4 family protein n=1 Tax=Streptomyces xanthophaeus TaxID=67385 RepID=UPI00365614BD